MTNRTTMMTMLTMMTFTMALAVLGCSTEIAAGEQVTEAVAPDATATDVAAAPDGALGLVGERSSLTFIGAKVTGKHDGGFARLTGELTVDGDAAEAATITIRLDSVFTDTERLTGHLLSGDFFDLDNHPTATFATTSITEGVEGVEGVEGAEGVDGAEGATHTVTGDLTLRGVTQEISFPATIEVGDDEVSASARFDIDRQRWGVSYPGMPDDLIKDKVTIAFDVVFAR